eukprot:4536642-Pyramimonas_sp.AAC.1
MVRNTNGIQRETWMGCASFRVKKHPVVGPDILRGRNEGNTTPYAYFSVYFCTTLNRIDRKHSGECGIPCWEESLGNNHCNEQPGAKPSRRSVFGQPGGNTALKPTPPTVDTRHVKRKWPTDYSSDTQ